MYRNPIFLFLIIVFISFQSCNIYKGLTNKPNDNSKSEALLLDTLGLEIAATDAIIQDTVIIENIKNYAIIDSLNKLDLQDSSNLILDTLSLVDHILNDTAAFEKVFKNQYSINDNITEDTRMLTGSLLMDQLDSLAEVKFFNKYEFKTDISELNTNGYAPNDIPVFSDSIYDLRIGFLNLHSPVELIYNEHVKAYINVYGKKGRKQTARMLGLKEIYFPIFEEVLDKYNLPLELKYLAVVESALNPTAGSRAGAKGLWQFMYHTGKRYGLNSNSLVDDRFDPYKSTEAAVRHLKDLFDIYNSWELALAAYNSGPGNVNRAIRRAGGVKNYWAIWPFLPRETRGYVPAFIAVNYVFSHAADHNIYPVHPGILHYGIDSVTVTDVLSFDQISEFMHIDIEDIGFLNPSYKQEIIPASKEQPYILRLPRDKIGYFIENENDLYNFKSKEGIEREKLLIKIKKAQERTIHIVRSGQNLGFIARQYRTSVSKIKSWNNMRNTRIYPGQKLIVYSGENNERKRPSLKNNKADILNKKTKLEVKPYGFYRYHTIKSGDTLWDLSRRYDSSVSQIKKWNGISNSHKLKLGEKLIVSEGG